MLQSAKHRNFVIVVAVLFIMWTLMLFRVDEPFYGHREGGSVWIAASIRGFNQFGIEEYRFLPDRTPGPSNPEIGNYYLHHPPLIVWFSTVGTWLFGFDAETGMPYESSLRLVAMFFTMVTLPMVYSLAKQLTNETMALAAFLLYSFTPMTIYFGRTPYYDMLVLPFVLAFTYVFVLWMRQFSWRKTWLLISLGVIAMWVAWAAAFFFALLGLVALIRGTSRHRLGIVLVGGVVGIATVMIPVMYELLRPGAITGLIDVALFRTSNLSGGPESEPFTASMFILVFILHMITVDSLAISVLGTLGAILLLMRKKTLETSVILALIIAPFVFMLVFRNAFHFHDWYKIHFMPGFALAAAIVIVRGWSTEPTNILKRYYKPMIFAVVVVSSFVTIYWTWTMYQFAYNEDAQTARAVVVELPNYTEIDDEIFGNITRPFPEMEYYAYRNITFGVQPTNVVQGMEEAESLDAYYLYCVRDGLEPLPDSLAALPSVEIADCQLITLQK